MKVINQTFVELNDSRLYQKVELCGRVCYKSEDKITETSGINFVKKICVNNHGSVLEHYALTFKVSKEYYDELKKADLNFFSLSNISFPLVTFNLRAFFNYYNENNLNEVLLPITNYMIKNYPDLFSAEIPSSNINIERIEDYSLLTKEERGIHQRVSVKLITDRGVTHELVRHRLASFSQESTRYCNYGKDKFGNEITVIKPSVISEAAYPVWEEAMKNAEKSYFKLLELNETPQIARSVLPNSLKTEICITASIDEWKLMFELRCAPQAHPDCREIMIKVRDYFIEKGYID